MANKVMDQKEYLRKYLSSGTAINIKKKKKKKIGSKTIKIIDDDIDLKNMRPMEDGEFEMFLDSEEAPQIAGIVDERGPVDFTDKQRWKIIADDNEGGDIKITSDNRQKQYQIAFESQIENNSIKNEDDINKHLKKNKKNNENKISTKKDEKDFNKGLSPRILKKGSKKNRISLEAETNKHHKQSESNSDNDMNPPSRQTQYSDDLLPSRKNKNYKSEKEMHRHKSCKYNSNNENTDLPLYRKSKGTNNDADKYEKEADAFKKYKNAKYDIDRHVSLPRKRKCSDDDLSPPRLSKEDSRTDNYDKDMFKSKKYKKYSKYSNSNDINSSRRQREESDDDLSPPRKSKEKKREDKYKKEINVNKHYIRSKYDSEYNMSPRRQRIHSDDLLLFRKSSYSKYREEIERKSSNIEVEINLLKRKHSYRKNSRSDDSDLSPPRRNQEQNNRNGRNYDLDLSPARQNRRKNNFYDNGKKHKQSSRSLSDGREKEQDLSSRYKYGENYGGDEKPRYETTHQITSDERDELVEKTLGGKTAGLKDLETLRKEIKAQKKHEAELNKLRKNDIGELSSSVPVQRDRRRLLKAEAAEQCAKEERQVELNEKYAVWGKGLKQVEDDKERLKRDLYEISKPLARYADDEDLNKEFREREREEDPMLEYLKQKQIKEGKRKPDRPSYQGAYMPNRFGIKPGHRWDGVDRSNGYEKKWFEAQNAKVAWQEEAYKWSTADM